MEATTWPTARRSAAITVPPALSPFSIPMSEPPSVNGIASTPLMMAASMAVSSRMPSTRQLSPLTSRHDRLMASVTPRPSSTTAGAASDRRV